MAPAIPHMVVKDLMTLCEDRHLYGFLYILAKIIIMRTAMHEVFNDFSLKNEKHRINFLIYSTILIVVLSVAVHHTPFYWMFTASHEDLVGWYPRFYLLAFVVLNIIKFLNFIILLFQIIFIFRYISVEWWKLAVIILVSSVPFFFFNNQWWIMSIILLIVYLYFLNKDPISHSQYKRVERIDFWLIIGFVFLAFIIRLIWILNTDNCGNGDAGARLIEAKHWINSIQTTTLAEKFTNIQYFLMPSTDWLPLHYYLMGITNILTDEWIYSSRILTALFGAVSIIPLYKLTLLKFNKLSAIISSVILTFWGYHIFLSSQTLSEVYYVFFILWAYYLIERWYRTQDNKSLLLLGFTLVSLCWLRYEGWFFSFFVVVLIPFIKQINNWKQYVVFSLLILFSTIYIMVLEIGWGLHPLKGILYSDYEVRLVLSEAPLSFSSIVSTYAISFIPLIFLSTLLFLSNLKYRKEIILNLLYLIPMSAFLYKTFNGTLTAQSRYIILYLTPLIPFLAYLISTILKRKYHLYFFLPLFVIIMNIFFLKSIFIDQSIDLKYNVGFHQSIQFCKKIKSGGFYLDNDPLEEGNNNWIVLSRSLSNKYSVVTQRDIGNREYQKVVLGTVQDSLNGNNLWEPSDLIELIKARKVHYLVFFPEGELNKSLKFKHENEVFDIFKFKRIFKKDEYMIYKVV